jgi:probable F420-dependent oxidoreductase
MKQARKVFRFGIVAAAATSGGEWIEKARRIEDLGFDTLVIPDTLGHTLSPFAALAAAAAATRRLRIGTYVLANDLRHPVLVAKDAATLDLISGGRFELGLGAGRPFAEADYRALGFPFESGGVRVSRLAESLRILKSLLAGDRVDTDGRYYSIQSAEIWPRPLQSPLPILVAGSGRRLLSLAAREADIVAFGVAPNAAEATAGEMIEWIQDAAGDRFADLELNLNLMAVGGRLPSYLSSSLGAGAEAFAQSDAVPVLKGDAAQMAGRLIELRERFGISYFMVSDELMDALAPVVERLAGQ